MTAASTAVRVAGLSRSRRDSPLPSYTGLVSGTPSAASPATCACRAPCQVGCEAGLQRDQPVQALGDVVVAALQHAGHLGAELGAQALGEHRGALRADRARDAADLEAPLAQLRREHLARVQRGVPPPVLVDDQGPYVGHVPGDVGRAPAGGQGRRREQRVVDLDADPAHALRLDGGRQRAGHPAEVHRPQRRVAAAHQHQAPPGGTGDHLGGEAVRRAERLQRVHRGDDLGVGGRDLDLVRASSTTAPVRWPRR